MAAGIPIFMDPRDLASTLTVDQIAALLVKVDLLTRRVEDQDRQLAWFRKQLFGAKSERRIVDSSSPDVQMWLGEQLLDVPETPPPTSQSVKSYERTHRKTPVEFMDTDSRLRFDGSVPIEIVQVPNPRIDTLADGEYAVLGEKVTYRLAQRSSYVILKYVQTTVKATGTGEIIRSTVPAAVFERSFADVSFLANMIVDKFCHHLPLYRQHKRLEQAGVAIERSTMTRLVHRTAQLLEPIFYALLSSIRLSEVLTMDESPTPAGVAPGEDGKPGKMKTGYFWAMFGDKGEVAFLFAPTRARSVIDEVLADFEGKLLTDGYKAYESFVKNRAETEHAQCWSHTRRKFLEAEQIQPVVVGDVVHKIRRLYDVERRFRDSSDEDRLLARQKFSKPIVDELFALFRAERDQALLLPSNPLLIAVEYALHREHELRVFLDAPAVPIDTNHVERTIRGPAVGRKNWMFHVTEVGARYAGIFYSLLKSCELCGVNPEVYLIDVLQRVDSHPADQVDLLTPRLWKEHFGAQPLRSALFKER